jgi:3-hydroxybutyryl-CoA dehydrogenase
VHAPQWQVVADRRKNGGWRFGEDKGRLGRNNMAQPIRKIGVIGAGQMGSGIAQVCALANIDVKLNDVSPERIKQALATVNGNLARQVSKQALTEDQRQAALKRIVGAEKLDDLGDCDLVIESATEKEEVKRKIFGDLCPSLKPDAILATNTSSISITRLAAITDRPERFIGIHFMNPVPRMELVELIRGIATADQTFEASKQFVLGLNKTIAVSEDFPAFIVNRILLPMINEAIYTLYESSARTIRWGRSNSPTLSASTPVSRSCRCCTKDWRIRNIARARCW